MSSLPIFKIFLQSTKENKIAKSQKMLLRKYLNTAMSQNNPCKLGGFYIYMATNNCIYTEEVIKLLQKTKMILIFSAFVSQIFKIFSLLVLSSMHLQLFNKVGCLFINLKHRNQFVSVHFVQSRFWRSGIKTVEREFMANTPKEYLFL